jgi:ankyrin repeat protein
MAALMNSFNVAHLLLQVRLSINHATSFETHLICFFAFFSTALTSMQVASARPLPEVRRCVTTLTFDTPCLNRNNLTPLHVSVSKNDKKMVTLLLEHSADVNATNKCDQSAAAFDVVKNVHFYEFAGGVERRCMRRL